MRCGRSVPLRYEPMLQWEVFSAVEGASDRHRNDRCVGFRMFAASCRAGRASHAGSEPALSVIH